MKNEQYKWRAKESNYAKELPTMGEICAWAHLNQLRPQSATSQAHDMHEIRLLNGQIELNKAICINVTRLYGYNVGRGITCDKYLIANRYHSIQPASETDLINKIK